MINSVTFRAPRCSVSDKFQMRPRTSLGSFAFSKISLAFSPKVWSVDSCRYQVYYSTRQHAIDGTRLLKQASILRGFRRKERRHADRPLTTDLRL